MRKILPIIFAVVLAISARASAHAFGSAAGTCGGDCRTCHKLDKGEAQNILRALNPQVKVLKVNLSPVGGLWEIEYEMTGKNGIGLVYLDYAKQHIIPGEIISVKDRKSLTRSKIEELNEKTVDFAKVPVKDALLLGRADAPIKAIVFDDPE